jgi:hypothetical protein
LEREALSVIVKCFVTTSRVSQSQLSVVWLVEVVSNVSLVSSMKRPLHRARQEEDRHSHGRRVRTETSRTYPVWIRRLDHVRSNNNKPTALFRATKSSQSSYILTLLIVTDISPIYDLNKIYESQPNNSCSAIMISVSCNEPDLFMYHLQY